MVRVVVCAAAEGVSIDQLSNRVTLFNLFDQIATPGFPVILAKIALFALLERDQTDEARVELNFAIRLNQTEVTSHTEVVDFGKGERGRIAIQLTGLPLLSPGLLSFFVSHAGVEIGKYSFKLVAIPASLLPPPVQEEPTGGAAREALAT